MAAFDLRVAVEHARFGLPEVAWGIIPGGGETQRIVRTVPFGIALELLMTGKGIRAAEAARWVQRRGRRGGPLAFAEKRAPNWKGR